MSVNSYTQGHDAATLASHQSRTAEKQADYLLPHIKPTDRILDVGCGPGTITCGLAKYVPQGTVTGVDYSEEVLAQARNELESQRVENVTFQAATAHELPFPDDSFDIVHCHAVLVHLPNAVGAMKEMRRVCTPGGYVAAREPDWDTTVMHPHHALLEKWKAAQAQLKRNEGAEPNAGRHLAEWAVEAGFDISNVRVTSNVLEYFGDELTWWGSGWAARLDGVLGDRAVQAGVVSRQDVQEIKEAYGPWARQKASIWAMMHMRLLARK